MSKESEYHQTIDLFEKFLHPNLAMQLRTIAHELAEEIKQDAKDHVMSKELQELDPMLNDYRKARKEIGESMAALHLKNIIKKIKELYHE